VVLVATVFLAACGGTSQDEFEEEIQSRGGGLGSDLAIEAIDALEAELGDDVALRSFTMSLGQVGMQALVPGTDDQLDNYQYGVSGLYGSGGLSEPTPVTGVGTARELRRSLFRPERIAFDDLDRIVDEGIETADLEDGYAQTVRIHRTTERAVITVDVATDRETAQVNFRGDGRPIGNGDG
jgi:hypothetical protein